LVVDKIAGELTTWIRAMSAPVVMKKLRFKITRGSVADVTGGRSRDALGARPFALQGTDRDHIMTA